MDIVPNKAIETFITQYNRTDRQNYTNIFLPKGDLIKTYLTLFTLTCLGANSTKKSKKK